MLKSNPTMHLLMLILGLLILAYTAVELLWTVFLEGGAPLTMHLIRAQASLFTSTSCRMSTRRLIVMAGPGAVVVSVLTWTILLWSGWTLILCSAPGAIVASADGQPASVAARLSYVGYTIFPLGLGDYRPTSSLWQLLTAVMAASGIFFFGVALAYVVPIISAATQKRQLGVVIWTLGQSPAQIIIRAWNGLDSTALNPHLISLIPMLAILGENHLTYPSLHFFHGSRRSSALAPAVAALDEALTILECGLQQGCSLDLPSLGAAREAITEFLQTLKPALIAPATETPPTPSLKELRDAGVSAVDDELFDKSVRMLAPRRRLLLALVQNEGWEWTNVWPAQPIPNYPATIPTSLTIAGATVTK